MLEISKVGDNMEQIFTGKIQKFYKGCPKSSGWFGCFFKAKGIAADIRLTGMTDIKLEEGMYLEVKALEENYKGSVGYKATSISILTKGRDAIIRYLSGSNFKHIGVVTASKIYDEFGEDAIEVIEKEPDKLLKLGLTPDMVQTLHTGVISTNVKNILQRDFPILKPKMISELVAKYDKQAVYYIRKNPYALIYTCDNITFDVANAIAIQLNISEDIRIMECLQFVIHDMTRNSGDVYLNISDPNVCYEIVTRVREKLSSPISDDKLQWGLNHIGDMQNIVVDCMNNEYHVYPEALYVSEKHVSNDMHDLLNTRPIYSASKKDTVKWISDYEDSTGFELDFDQRLAVITSLHNRFSIIKGGPGHGKTTVIDCILYCYKKNNSKKPILAAPTGKASRRLTESVSKSHKYEASTIMRQLFTFHQTGISTQYERTLIVIDECSMVNLLTAAQMIDLYKTSQIVLVGDVDQLPSIEQGQFFKDLCDLQCIPQTELTIPHRAHSYGCLIDNADAINAGDLANTLTYDSGVFDLYEFQYDDETYQQFIVNMCKDLISNKTDIKDFCVLCPTNSGLTGVKELNLALQNALNPLKSNVSWGTRGYEIKNTYYGVSKNIYTRLRVGDRVMQTKNRPDAEYRIFTDTGNFKSAGVGIFNGDCGTIISTDGNKFIDIKMDDGRIYRISHKHFDEITLAYAMTVHKAQGCEYDIVIFSSQCSLTGAWFKQNNFATRNLLYTAITRAKKSVRIIGSIDSLNQCISTKVVDRNSMLQYRIPK